MGKRNADPMYKEERPIDIVGTVSRTNLDRSGLHVNALLSPLLVFYMCNHLSRWQEGVSEALLSSVCFGCEIPISDSVWP